VKGRAILAAVFLLLGLAAGWMAWLTWRAGEEGQWLFGVFAAFFLILAAAPFLPAPKKEPSSPAWSPIARIWLNNHAQ